MTYTAGPWILHNLVDEQGRAMTPGEVGAHIADRIRRTIKDGNGSDKHLFVETEEPNELTICDIGNGPNGMANGQLIIAAPDMLAALKLALKQIKETQDALLGQGLQIAGWHLNGDLEPVESFFSDSDCGAVEAIEAAIAKAEGRTE